MKFQIAHTNLNVLDLDKSLAFYKEALGLHEVRRKNAPDGSFTLVFLSDDEERYQIELTWLAGRKEPYNLGDNEIHIAFTTLNIDEALQKHRDMGVVVYENPDMGIYFIADPDGYWMEIIPVRR